MNYTPFIQSQSHYDQHRLRSMTRNRTRDLPIQIRDATIEPNLLDYVLYKENPLLHICICWNFHIDKVFWQNFLLQQPYLRCYDHYLAFFLKLSLGTGPCSH